MRRSRDDDGASLVEVAVVLPLLLTLAVGLAEIGFLVIDYITVTNAARSGARTGGAAAQETTADDDILAVVEEDLCNLKNGEVVRVTIYRADPDGAVLGGALNEFVPGVGGLDCGNASHNFVDDPMGTQGWAPGTGRNNQPPDMLDQLGVKIEFTHDYVTGFLPFPDVTFSETAVMQLEPDTSGIPST